ncbi:MAG TPA: hypothetical protein VFB49_02160 [Patescibacteria group bacterium]|nr:hypothetical protein [Patescibacteria group bacterium]
MAMMTLFLALAMVAPSGAAAPRPAKAEESIAMHTGVPGKAYIGQPLTEFLARFPGTKSLPFAKQDDVVRLQVAGEGISALAMGATPATMTIESIGFNFEGTYEGVAAGRRRTVEGIGPGSTINDMLGTYGKPAETASEKRHVSLTPSQPQGGAGAPPAPADPTRYIYHSADGGTVTYFVIKDAMVVRMVINRLESIKKHLMDAPQGSGSPATGGPDSAAPAEHP